MKWLTLTRIKQQLRIEADFTDEDDLLEMYGDTSEEAILMTPNRTYEELFEKWVRVPSPVVSVSLMLVASLYKDREKDLTQDLKSNPTFKFLLAPYMRLAERSYEQSNNNGYGCKNL